METEVNEFAVKPQGAPVSSSVVTMVTPVAKCPNARRKSWASISVSFLSVMR